MKQVLLASVLAFMMVGTLGHTAPTDEGPAIPEDYLDVRPGLDPALLDRLEPVAFETVTLDKFIGDRTALPASSLFGQDAGCDTTGGSPGWAVAGTPSGPCEHETHDWPIRYAVHDCPNGCYSDAWAEDPIGLFIFGCSPGARSIFDFQTLEATHLGTGECDIAGWGQLPIVWTHWDGQGWVRDMKFSYTDNLEDALVHLVA